MLSVDANLLLYSYSEAAPQHDAARRFIASISAREDVALSEFVLTEFYLLLRNPAVLAHPLLAPEAVGVIQSYRQHPRWQVVGFPPASRELHGDLWQRAAEPAFARRRIYDTRTALSLRAFGVTDFATANEKDFQGFGFGKVWNPVATAQPDRLRAWRDALSFQSVSSRKLICRARLALRGGHRMKTTEKRRWTRISFAARERWERNRWM